MYFSFGAFCVLDGILLARPSRALFLSSRSYVWCTTAAGYSVSGKTSEVRFSFTMKDTSPHLKHSYLKNAVKWNLQHYEWTVKSFQLMLSIVMKWSIPYILNKRNNLNLKFMSYLIFFFAYVQTIRSRASIQWSVGHSRRCIFFSRKLKKNEQGNLM
jgi:hypothetical protein